MSNPSQQDLDHLRHAIRLSASQVEAIGPLPEDEAWLPFEAFSARESG